MQYFADDSYRWMCKEGGLPSPDKMSPINGAAGDRFGVQSASDKVTIWLYVVTFSQGIKFLLHRHSGYSNKKSDIHVTKFIGHVW